jgi:exopolyphosphatase/guanosine-5'-triphosphate,3'-diphosphate pyrophosphatase
VSTSALREGVLYDLIGRTHQRDIRDDAVRRMQERYGVDLEQSERMESLLLDFAHQALPSWGLNTPENRQSLRWAARLYEIGKAINYTGYHRHGAYLIANSEMVGFSRQEQSRLAALVLGQRRKLIPQRIKEMVGDQVDRLMPLIVLLRLASRLNRTRNPKPKPQIGVSVDQRNIHISFPTHWIEERPLTSADLTLEATRLAQVGFNLRWHLDS